MALPKIANVNQASISRGRVTNPKEAGIDWLLAILIFLSIWGPAPDTGYPEYLDSARYYLYPFVAAVFLIRHNIRTCLSISVIRGTPSFWLIIMFLYWCISSFWSDEIQFSLQRSVILAMTSMIAICAVNSLKIEVITRTFVLVLLLFVISGVLTAIFMPYVGLENSYQHAGKWRGLSSQKNPFAMIAATTAVLLMSTRSALPGLLAKSEVIRVSALLLCVTAIYMADSRSAAVSVFVGTLIITILRFNKGTKFHILMASLFIPLLLLLLLSNVWIDGAVIHIFDQEIDTNNRITIWRFAFDQWQGREIFGLGYGGFWAQQRANEFFVSNGWVLENFHNGYIAIIVETGFVGMAVLVLYLLSLLYNSIISRKFDFKIEFHSYFALISMFIIHNLYENNLSRSMDIFLILFIISNLIVFSKRRVLAKAGSVSVSPAVRMQSHS